MSDVVITGNPIEGFCVVGPFDSEEEAYMFVADADDDAWVTTLIDPDD